MVGAGETTAPLVATAKAVDSTLLLGADNSIAAFCTSLFGIAIVVGGERVVGGVAVVCDEASVAEESAVVVLLAATSAGSEVAEEIIEVGSGCTETQSFFFPTMAHTRVVAFTFLTAPSFRHTAPCGFREMDANQTRS